ncbi:hypothetical protein Q8F55_007331 [Vanrija albida]|uniref:Ricin B lectin domain-containing protein n=1 Tax=Vanrija albida TaxID=181172 RepID=A0ABR3PZG5_9TREE
MLHLITLLLLACAVFANPLPDTGETHLDTRQETYGRLRTYLTDGQNRTGALVVSKVTSIPLVNGDWVVTLPTVNRVYSSWSISEGYTGQAEIAVSGGKRFCLDAGSYPGNGVRLKVWECLDVPQQQWHFANGRLELVGYGLCADLRDGALGTARGYVQTWQCYDGNINQKWRLY